MINRVQTRLLYLLLSLLLLLSPLFSPLHLFEVKLSYPQFLTGILNNISHHCKCEDLMNKGGDDLGFFT